MISYCVAVLRPAYARLLVEELVSKSSVPYEILLWLNVADAELEAFIAEASRRKLPVRVVGRTPENIGMRAYRNLFRAARHPMLVQIDDDVVCVSRRIAERAARIFASSSAIRQVVADVWQDEHTTGARPPLVQYRCVDEREGLYDGPIDGWFSIYHRSVLPLLLALPYSEYCRLGAMMRQQLVRRGLRGLLCTRMRVFHVIGPAYASFFGMLDAEIAKYRRIGRQDVVDWYVRAMPGLPSRDDLQSRYAGIRLALEENLDTREKPFPSFSSEIPGR